MRLTRVRNSLADITPSRCSPGTFMKRGSPAPVPTKIFQNPASLRSSRVAVLPTTKFLTNRPPSSRDLADHVVDQRVRQAELGNAVAQHAAEVVERLEDGDRKAFRRQKIGVDQAGGAGADHRNRRLLGPRPRADVAPGRSGRAALSFVSFSRSGRNHSSWPISIGRPVMVQTPWHCSSCGQTRPVTFGSGLQLSISSRASRELARAQKAAASPGCGS